jgi:hypothetical protein
VALAALPPLGWLARVGYRLVAYNRHLLAPKDPTRIRCACDADFHLGYRLGLLALATVFTLGTAAAFASTLSHGLLAEGPSVLGYVLAVLGLSIVVALPALRLPRERAFDWLGHVAVVAAEAAVALWPAVVLSRWVEGAVLQAVQAASILLVLVVFSWSSAVRMRAMRFVLTAPVQATPVPVARESRPPPSP